MPSSGRASELAVEFVDSDKNLRSFAPLGGWGHPPLRVQGCYPCWLGTAAWSGETAIDSALAFSSEISSPARMHAAPIPALVPRRSPRKMNEVSQANTG